MLCVLILYISGATYSLKSTPNDRFFEKLFMATFIMYSQSTHYLLDHGDFIHTVYIPAKIEMSFFWKDDFFLPKSASSVNRSQAHLAKRKRIRYTIIFVRRKDKINYLSNQTLKKIEKKTLDGGPFS